MSWKVCYCCLWRERAPGNYLYQLPGCWHNFLGKVFKHFIRPLQAPEVCNHPLFWKSFGNTSWPEPFSFLLCLLLLALLPPLTPSTLIQSQPLQAPKPFASHGFCKILLKSSNDAWARVLFLIGMNRVRWINLSNQLEKSISNKLSIVKKNSRFVQHAVDRSHFRRGIPSSLWHRRECLFYGPSK